MVLELKTVRPKLLKQTITITITKEYLDNYIDKIHPEEGNAFNILFSADDPKKYEVIPYLLFKKVNQYKALEFALQKKDYTQAEDLFNHLNFEPAGSLIAAIQNNSLILAQYFVEQKEADVNFNCFGSNLLDVAAKLEEPYKTEITNYLLEKGAVPLDMTLERAVQDSQNVNNSEQNDLYNKQIFFKAIKENNFELVKKLVETYKFDINTEYAFQTPLSVAINLKNGKEIIDYFLSKKADPNIAMTTAIEKGNLEGVKILLEAGANIHDTSDGLPITIAAEHGCIEIVQYLLEKGAKCNVTGWYSGGVSTSLLDDVKITVDKLSKAWEEANNLNINSLELENYFINILNILSHTSISSNYNGYDNLSLEQIHEQFPNFITQLDQDFQNFIKIKELLEDYSSGKKVSININASIDDISDPSFESEAETKTTKTGSRLEHIPSKSGIFHTFSLDGLNKLDEDQTSLGNNTDIFEFEL